MPYPREHAAHTRMRIVRSAQALFHEHGFDSVSIRDIMANAGLTHGSFYRYFRTKGELYAEVVGIAFDFAGAAAPNVVRAYLSRRHLENLGRQCPLIALPSDVARGDPAVKASFENVFRDMVRCFERDARGKRRASDALAIAGMCVGAMTVSRALADPVLARKLREATLLCALRLGGWLGSERAERERYLEADAEKPRVSSSRPASRLARARARRAGHPRA